jgi:anti-sigma factor RsiW
MTMTCHESKELTVPYLELDLEPSRIRDVTAHLDGCAGCRTEMEAVRQVLVRVKGVAVPDPGDRFWNEFPDKVRRALARERPPIPSGLRKGMAGWPMALAASVLLLVGAWSLKGMFAQGPAPSQPRAVAQVPRAAEPELPQFAEAEWHEFWDEDPDMALVEMAAGLDRQAVDRLFGDI